MSTRIQQKILDDVAILSVEEKLISGPDVAILHDHIRALVKEGIVRVVIDFSSVSWFGSAMLGVLAASYATLKNVGGDVKLIGMSKKLIQIMDVTRLAEVFETQATLDEAIASLREENAIGA